MKIGIVIGSIRENRVGADVAHWLLNYIENKNIKDTTFEIVDLKNYPLPLLGVKTNEEDEKVINKWKSKMQQFDGYIFVTPEYNRVIPGAFKNALDYLQIELNNKAAGYVGYGGLGSLSAIQSLRLINAEQSLAGVRTMVTFSIMSDFENMQIFKPNDYHKHNIDQMLEQLISWSKALKTIR